MTSGDLARGAVVDLGDHAAQHGGGVDTADEGIAVQTHLDGVDLVGLDVYDKEAGGDIRQVARNRAAQVVVDLPDGGQYREPKAEGQHNRPGLAPRTANGGEGHAQGGHAAQDLAVAQPAGRVFHGDARQDQRGEGPAKANEAPHRQRLHAREPRGDPDQQRQNGDTQPDEQRSRQAV